VRGLGRIALVGLPASGKTTIGRELAEVLGIEFLDSDELVRAEAGRSVDAIFAEEGEAAFRARESRALAEAGAGPPCVLATGGGAVISASNRGILKRRFITIWLRAQPETAVSRAALAPGSRPLLEHAEPLARMRELAADREGRYAEVSALVVDVEGRGSRELALEIARRLDGGAALDGGAGAAGGLP